MGVHRGPHLFGHGQTHRYAELGIGDRTADHKGDDPDQQHGDEPPSVGVSAAPEREPDSDEQGDDDAGPAWRRPVEIGAQDENTAKDDPTPRRPFQHAK